MALWAVIRHGAHWCDLLPNTTDTKETSDMTLEQEFSADVLAADEECKRELHYSVTRFERMVRERGAVATAKWAVRYPITNGFEKLWQAGRLDLTIEAMMLRPKYHELFTDAELGTAYRRVGSELHLIRN
jgi:hypothetical protein